MGGYPRYCLQCGSGLTPNTRFCGNCGQATAAAATETDLPGLPDQQAANPPETEAPAGHWRDVAPSSATTPDLVNPPGLVTPPGLAASPGFAAPPTGPAYPPPPRPSPAEPSALSSPAELPPPLVLPPTESVPPPGRPMPPPPDRPGLSGPDRAGTGPRPTYLPAQDRSGSGPRPAYPPPPAQYALPPGSPSSPPPPASAGPTGETAKFGTSWVNQVSRNPQWDQAPARAQWPQGPPPPARPVITSVRTADSQPRKRQLLSIALFALIAAVLVVPAFLIVHALHGLGGSSAAAAEPTSKPSKSASAPATERSAATALAGLLAQSVTDRDTIVSAVGAVNHCTSAVSQAPAHFQEGATSRQKLLKQLASMSGRSELPAGMLSQLTTAWQASAAVDTDLSKWAQDEVSSGCHQHNDANLAAADGPDAQASNAKKAFVAMWNPIAAKYGLTKYSTSQL